MQRTLLKGWFSQAGQWHLGIVGEFDGRGTPSDGLWDGAGVIIWERVLWPPTAHHRRWRTPGGRGCGWPYQHRDAPNAAVLCRKAIGGRSAVRTALRPPPSPPPRHRHRPHAAGASTEQRLRPAATAVTGLDGSAVVSHRDPTGDGALCQRGRRRTKAWGGGGAYRYPGGERQGHVPLRLRQRPLRTDRPPPLPPPARRTVLPPTPHPAVLGEGRGTP